MKKLSLIIAILLSSLNLKASSLEKAILDGKSNIQFKSYYFTKSHKTDPKESIWINGTSINYITKPIFDTAIAGFTLQTAHKTDIDKDTPSTSKFKADMYGSGAVLSESYLATKINKTGIKIGRQYIRTPLILGSDTRMITQSFQGITAINKDIKDSTILLIYLDKYQTRTDSNGNVGKFSNVFDYIGVLDGKATLKDGVNSLLIKNNSIKNLNITYQHLNAKDFAKTNFLQLTYNIKPKYNLKFTIQQYRTTWNTQPSFSNSNDGIINGYKLESTFNNINLFGAYSKNDTDGNILGGLGLAADAITTAGYVNGGNYLNNSSSVKFGINTKINDIKLSIWKMRHKNENNNIYDHYYDADYCETDYIADYDITKNLHLRVLFAKFSGTLAKLSDTPNYNYKSRVRLTYSF